MNRYNKESLNGKSVVARFCLCGHASIIVSASPAEHDIEEQQWNLSHSGPGHATIDFDNWIAAVLGKSLSTAS